MPARYPPLSGGESAATRYDYSAGCQHRFFRQWIARQEHAKLPVERGLPNEGAGNLLTNSRESRVGLELAL